MSTPERLQRITTLKAALSNPTITLSELQSLEDQLLDEDLLLILREALSAFETQEKTLIFHTFLDLLAMKEKSTGMRQAIQGTKTSADQPGGDQSSPASE